MAISHFSVLKIVRALPFHRPTPRFYRARETQKASVQQVGFFSDGNRLLKTLFSNFQGVLFLFFVFVFLSLFFSFSFSKIVTS